MTIGVELSVWSAITISPSSGKGPDSDNALLAAPNNNNRLYSSSLPSVPWENVLALIVSSWSAVRVCRVVDSSCWYRLESFGGGANGNGILLTSFYYISE